MPNKMERFTNQAKQVLVLSQTVAEELNAPDINAIHLLVGMTRAEKSDAWEALHDNNIFEPKLLPVVKSYQETVPAESTQALIGLNLSEACKKVLELSVESALRHDSHYINSAHLLVGLMRLVNESQQQQHEIAMLKAILEHFQAQAAQIIASAESYLADVQSHEPVQKTRPIRQIIIPEEPAVAKLFRGIFGFAEEQENDGNVTMNNEILRFTNSSRRVLKLSEEIAKELNTPLIMPVHLLLAMASAEYTDAYLTLEDYDIIASKLMPFVKLKRPPSETEIGDIAVSNHTREVLTLAAMSARRHEHFWVGSGHMLIGLLHYEEDELIAEILTHFDVLRIQLITRVQDYLEDSSSQEQQTIEEEARKLQSEQPGRFSKLFRRMFGFTSKRKNDEK